MPGSRFHHLVKGERMEVVHEEVEQKSDGKVECSNSGLEAAGWLVGVHV